ncbi:MAG: TlpA family protein disulfide reductase [Chloroflexi bacterium]|nr:TlpA family protein disulfide reductase [Chloroflexota bacterium]
MSETVTPPSVPDVQPEKRSRGGSALFIGVLALAGLALLAVFYYGVLNPSSQQIRSGAAPDFEITTFDGETIRLSDFRGMPVVVNFWASWCVTCRDEQPILEDAWRRYKGRVMFIGLDYLDQEPNALAYLEEFDVTYPNGPDKGSRAYAAFNVQGVPETFFIDAEGNVQGFHVGPITYQQLEERIQALLSESGS